MAASCCSSRARARVLHPAYSGVTLGLIHGSAPHAYVLCHMAGEQIVDENPQFPMPSLRELVDLHEQLSLIARRATVQAIALNTRHLDEAAARRAVEAAEAETGLPADDPVRFGAAKLVDALEPLVRAGSDKGLAANVANDAVPFRRVLR